MFTWFPKIQNNPKELSLYYRTFPVIHYCIRALFFCFCSKHAYVNWLKKKNICMADTWCHKEKLCIYYNVISRFPWERISINVCFQTMALVIVLTFFVLLANAEKRILLKDPDVIHSQLHTLEQKMEDVMAWKAEITVKYKYKRYAVVSKSR